MSDLINRGLAELAQRESDQVLAAQWATEENLRTVRWWFKFCFRPAEGFNLDEWQPTRGGDVHAPSSFIYEGLRFEVAWKYEGGCDRADWDNGWWPTWTLVLRQPRRWRLPPKTIRRSVWTAQGVAAAVREAKP